MASRLLVTKHALDRFQEVYGISQSRADAARAVEAGVAIEPEMAATLLGRFLAKSNDSRYVLSNDTLGVFVLKQAEPVIVTFCRFGPRQQEFVRKNWFPHIEPAKVPEPEAPPPPPESLRRQLQRFLAEPFAILGWASVNRVIVGDDTVRALKAAGRRETRLLLRQWLLDNPDVANTLDRDLRDRTVFELQIDGVRLELRRVMQQFHLELVE